MADLSAVTALLARACAPRLDARLSRGADPRAGRLLAARAGQLRDGRHELADAWADRLFRAHRPGAAGGRSQLTVARVPLLAAEDDVLALVALLHRSAPVPVRTLAAARQLLVDGAGPVFHGGATLGPAIRGILAACGVPCRGPSAA